MAKRPVRPTTWTRPRSSTRPRSPVRSSLDVPAPRQVGRRRSRSRASRSAPSRRARPRRARRVGRRAAAPPGMARPTAEGTTRGQLRREVGHARRRLGLAVHHHEVPAAAPSRVRRGGARPRAPCARPPGSRSGATAARGRRTRPGRAGRRCGAPRRSWSRRDAATRSQKQGSTTEPAPTSTLAPDGEMAVQHRQPVAVVQRQGEGGPVGGRAGRGTWRSPWRCSAGCRARAAPASAIRSIPTC